MNIRLIFSAVLAASSVACVSRNFSDNAEVQRQVVGQDLTSNYADTLIIEQRGRDTYYLHKNNINVTQLNTKQVTGQQSSKATEEYGEILIHNRTWGGAIAGWVGPTEPYQAMVFKRMGECFFKMTQQDKGGVIKYERCSGGEMNAKIIPSKEEGQFVLEVYPQRKDGFGHQKPLYLKFLSEYVEKYPILVSTNEAFSTTSFSANWPSKQRFSFSIAHDEKEEKSNKFSFHCPQDTTSYPKPTFTILKNVSTTGGLGSWTINRSSLPVKCMDKTYFPLDDERILWGLAFILPHT